MNNDTGISFDALFLNASMGIMVANAKGIIELANLFLLKQFGYNEDEVLGQRIEKLTPSRFHQRHVKHVEQYNEHPKSRPMGLGMELALIPRSEFEELIGSNPSVMKKFIGILARNIDDNEEKLLAIAYNSLRKKVADTLIILYRKYNQKNDESFHIDLSRENLAAIAGVAKESLIRMLSELKDEKLIVLEGSKIKILNYAKLLNMYN
ncbi:MAG: helix-turn-helix domain-containing protein [Taibaiella sp.]